MSIISVPGGPRAAQTANGGKIYPNNGLTSGGFTVVAPANPSRVSITFHNPGTVDAFIFTPNCINPVTGANVVITPAPPTTLGGCFLVFANGGSLTIGGECQQQWQAVSRSGSGNPLTVMDSNV